MNRGNEQRLVERRDRGVIRHASTVYGSSVEGIPLTVYLPDDGSAEIVVLASIHGDEAETTVVVSEALRCIPRGDLQAAVILCGNPDGMLRGTRGNGRGVDLNRNFPTSNWTPDPVCYKSRASDARDIALSPGAQAASEPETNALRALLERLRRIRWLVAHRHRHRRRRVQRTGHRPVTERRTATISAGVGGQPGTSRSTGITSETAPATP